jgi:hypothetical protein
MLIQPCPCGYVALIKSRKFGTGCWNFQSGVVGRFKRINFYYIPALAEANKKPLTIQDGKRFFYLR